MQRKEQRLCPDCCGKTVTYIRGVPHCTRCGRKLGKHRVKVARCDPFDLLFIPRSWGWIA